MTLEEANIGHEYRIESITSSDETFVAKTSQLGLVAGELVCLKRKAPWFKDPMLFSTQGSLIAMTKREASKITVRLVS